tara:strand:- start:3837 stop:4844 length:1008 start_codon:yes stop_codon:yes gene_type:complete
MKTIGILATITSLGMLTTVAQTQEPRLQPASPNAPVATEASASPPRAATGKPTIVTVKPKPSRLVHALDSNQDGKLSVEEIEAAVAILKGLDQDGNGELTSDEFGPVVAAKKPTSRSILRPTNPTNPSKPSTINRPKRPSRRPTAKPTRPGTRPARVATSKNPPSRLKRPSGRPRPAGRPARSVAKASASTSETNKSSSSTAAPSRPINSRVISSSNARKKTRTNSRRNPTAAGKAKPKVLQTPPQKALAEGISTREELIALQAEAKQILDGLKQSVGTIKDGNKKRTVLQWVRKDYRQLSQSLSTGLRSNDIEAQKTLIEETKQKIAEAKQLLK